ncbi:myeloid differentiation primary response protein MyD88 isoform X1 [Diaphorina citri]|uniref:Myeloid differentiation primary response protein MyD88 isoform X1 n=1 Tax=Diaphorina citri TaxID=121845 RepID=A0A1S3DU91_DIACI|nr:myeloid differentiation primary response protein MyD88 isoform X1 [Diaphorina citri]
MMQCRNMDSNHDVEKYRYEDSMDYIKIPIEAIRPKTRQVLNDKLCDIKQLMSPENYQRDYRGLADLMDIKAPPNPNCEDLMKKMFEDWTKSSTLDRSVFNIATFLHFLECIDRFDVYDDCIGFIEEDCLYYENTRLGNSISKNGACMDDPSVITIEDVKSLNLGCGLAHYDALLLYDEADFDLAKQFNTQLNKMGFTVCDKDNSFLTGQFEHSAFIQVMDRCTCVIVLMSTHFMNNSLLHSLTQYAEAKHIDHTIHSKIIPILCSDDYFSVGFLQYCVKLKLNHYASNMEQFWDRLYYSLKGVGKGSQKQAIQFQTTPTSMPVAPPDYTLSQQAVAPPDYTLPQQATNSQSITNNMSEEKKDSMKKPMLMLTLQNGIRNTLKVFKPNKKKTKALCS